MDLSVLRERVNDIDDQMVALFVERMRVAAEIAGRRKPEGRGTLHHRV